LQQTNRSCRFLLVPFSVHLHRYNMLPFQMENGSSGDFLNPFTV
jgi:hypothetical protein